MKKALKTSVIIPIYNEADYIAACIESILAQTQPVDEIIVIDNNSTDDSVQIVRQYDAVQIIHEAQQGIHYGRTAGFDYAHGDLLLKLDADTILDPRWHASMQQAFSQSAVVACSGYIQYYDGYIPLLPEWCNRAIRRFIAAGFNSMCFRINGLLTGNHSLYGAIYALRAETWQAIRSQVSHEAQIWEDLDTALIISHQKRGSIAILRQPRTRVSVRSGKTSIRHFSWRMLGWARTYWPYRKFGAFFALCAGVVSLLLTLPFLATMRFNRLHSSERTHSD